MQSRYKGKSTNDFVTNSTNEETVLIKDLLTPSHASMPVSSPTVSIVYDENLKAKITGINLKRQAFADREVTLASINQDFLNEIQKVQQR